MPRQSRWHLRLLIAALSAQLGWPSAESAETILPRFSGVKVERPTPACSETSVRSVSSPGGQALTVLFDQPLVDLRDGQGPAHATRRCWLRLQFAERLESPVGVLVDVRSSEHKTASPSLIFEIVLPEQRHRFNFAPGQELNASDTGRRFRIESLETGSRYLEIGMRATARRATSAGEAHQSVLSIDACLLWPGSEAVCDERPAKTDATNQGTR